MTISRTKGGKFVVKSHKKGKSGALKRLSKPTTKAKAVERLRQVEYFKKHKP
jgi:hypothetical protein